MTQRKVKKNWNHKESFSKVKKTGQIGHSIIMCWFEGG
jgi:hypothetical protein